MTTIITHVILAGNTSPCSACPSLMLPVEGVLRNWLTKKPEGAKAEVQEKAETKE